MSRTFERALVILNPYSGRGHGERGRDELVRLLRTTSTRYDIVETERPGHAIELARAGRLAGYELVVAAGGDGTISEVVNGLLQANEQMVEQARVVALEAARMAALARAVAQAEKAAAKAARTLEKVAAAARLPLSEPVAAEVVAPEVVAAAGVGSEGVGTAGVGTEGGALAAEPPALAVDSENGAGDATATGEEETPAESSAAFAAEADEEADTGLEPEPEFVFTVPPELEVAGTLGVVPVGSGNDFASMVGIPLEMAAAVKMLERQRLRLVDVGSATVHCAPGSATDGTAASGGARTFHRYFDNNMGIGLEASVIIESNKIRRLRGALLYATAAIRALFKHRSPRMHVRWTTQAGEEGSHDKPTLLVSVGNSRRAGGGFFLTPDAEMDDKQLDVAIADDISRPAVMALLPKALQGKHTTHPAVTMLRIEKLTIQVPDGAPVQMDGEIVEEHACAVEVTVLPHKLQLIA